MSETVTTELDIAHAIRDGALDSPQKFGPMWMFAIRITGTGAAYRVGLDEFCWRDPALYLNEEFCARCNGLPVIWEHPEKNTLNSEEFGNRVVGTIMLAYIKGEDVWGIARIYDNDTATAMCRYQLSTSPAVVFRNSEDNSTIVLDSGETLLVEGKPALLDHVAICAQGVWDKGGDPVGVDVSGDSAVTEKTEGAEDRKDADAAPEPDIHAKLNEIMDCLGTMRKDSEALKTRMDAVEGKGGAPDGDVKVKADAEAEAKEKEEKERADAARKDAEALKARMDGIEDKLKERSDSDAAEMADAQAKADSVAMAFGDSAPRPMAGETVHGYRLRSLKPFQKHSKAWNGRDISKLPPDALAVVADQIYADAATAARDPSTIPAGEMRRRVIINPDTGHRIIEYEGNSPAWMNAFRRPPQRMVRINNNPGGR